MECNRELHRTQYFGKNWQIISVHRVEVRKLRIEYLLCYLIALILND